MRATEDDIRNHRRVKLTEIEVLRAQNLTVEKCQNEVAIRQFCANRKKTLPDMIEIEVFEIEDENLQWHIVVWENPNVAEGAE